MSNEKIDFKENAIDGNTVRSNDEQGFFWKITLLPHVCFGTRAGVTELHQV